LKALSLYLGKNFFIPDNDFPHFSALCNLIFRDFEEKIRELYAVAFHRLPSIKTQKSLHIKSRK